MEHKIEIKQSLNKHDFIEYCRSESTKLGIHLFDLYTIDNVPITYDTGETNFIGEFKIIPYTGNGYIDGLPIVDNKKPIQFHFKEAISSEKS